MNKYLIAASLLAAGFSAPLYAEELSKDQELSCSALLCLSSSVGGSLSECNESLTEYYSISAKKMSDIIKKRKNFLKLCPASEEEGMPELVDAISQGAGRCDAEQLNNGLEETRYVQVNCKYSSGHRNYNCETQKQYRIKNKLPSYCQVYIDNSYTDLNLHYSGTPTWQSQKDFSKNKSGKWVN
ncbi:conjugal transfer protein [Salmonella enterica subsp. enterica serovar Wichita]|nr:conjugal transfer protein [Salmonella enterica subsp. enterica serovar Wichita]